MNHRGLLRHCVDILDTFNPDLLALEEHLSSYFEAFELEGDEQTFATEVFSGCVRYSNVLQVALNGFYVRDGKNMLRSEENLYKVICYLALFRLDELGMPHFSRFVRTQDVNKMFKFLNFFLNEKHLLTWMKDEWNKVYENSFVQTNLLSPLQRWLPELQELIKQLKDKIDNKIKPKKLQIESTVTKPFSLTQPRPRSVPMPMPIPKLKPSKPVPKSTYEVPVEQNIISKIREANRRKAEERLMGASKQQFACSNPVKSEKTKQRMMDIMQEEESRLDFERHKSHPLPTSMLSDNIPIKLNTAAILREGKLYQKREDEEIKKLERLEAGAHDASNFINWQTEMRQRDLDEELASIERRRLEGKLSYEEAILARKNLIEENKTKVSQMKEEARKMMQDYLEQRFAQETEMKQLVEETLMGHENAKKAKKKLQQYKQKIVQEMNKESQELMRLALEEAETEMRQKMTLIQEIRAMEARPINRVKLVDLTEPAGHGLLSEMSIAELRERLTFLQYARNEEEDRKRDEILETKTAKDQMLLGTLDMISKHRSEYSKAAALKFEEKKKTRNNKMEIKDEKLSELQKRLQEKKAERLKIQSSAKVGADPVSINRSRALIKSKKASEESRWRELEQTRERTAKLSSQGVSQSASARRIAGQTAVMAAT